MAVKDFFDNLNGGARWDVGVSINRSNSLPLDANSVFASLEAAQNYAAGNPAEGTLANAYPGQVLAVVTDAETIIYYIDANMTLQPVGNTKDIMAYIGDIPETSDAKTIIEYINSKTEGIATTDSLAQLQRDVDAVEALVGKEAADGVEATGLVKGVADNAAAIAAETSAREAADKAIADSIGELAEGKTVVQMIEDAQTAATYDDKAVRGLIADNTSAIDAIEADYLKVADKTELSGKITEVEGKIPTKVGALENDAGYLTAIPEEYITETELTAKGYQTAAQVETIVNSAIAEINNAVFEKVDAVPAVADAVANVLYLVPNGNKMDIYAKIGEEMVLIDDTDADLSGYAKTEDVNTEFAKKVDVTTYNERVTAVDQAIAGKADASALDSYVTNETYNAKMSSIDQDLAQKLIAADLADYAKTADVVVKTVYEAKVAEIDESLAKKLEADALTPYATSEYVDAELAKKADKATTLAGYGITDAYTKTETLDKIAEKITEINGGESAGEVLGQLNSYKETNDARVLAAETDIDNLQTAVGDSNSGLVKGLADLTAVVDGHTEDIADLVKKDEELNAAIGGNTEAIGTINEKLAGIAAGAQVNVIEGIIFNGETLTVGEDKIVEIAYNLPIADADTLGGVKSSDAQNKILVAEDGTMEVNSVNVNKLVQDEGTFVIMNGGSASV